MTTCWFTTESKTLPWGMGCFTAFSGFAIFAFLLEFIVFLATPTFGVRVMRS